jgi:hypothetical protein
MGLDASGAPAQPPQPGELSTEFTLTTPYAEFALAFGDTPTDRPFVDISPTATPVPPTPTPEPPTPTPRPIPPTPKPPTVYAQAAAPVTGGVEQWRSLVASIFPADTVDAVLRVMACESGGNPMATGRLGERGLMQIHPLHKDSTYDPEGNLRAAYRISGGGASWAAWGCKP